MISTGTQIFVTGADGFIGSPEVPAARDISARLLNVPGSAELVAARHVA